MRRGALADTGTRKQIRQTLPPVRGCVGLWQKEKHPGDAEEAVGRVGPVWAEIDEGVLQGYLQSENSMKRGTASRSQRPVLRADIIDNDAAG